MNQAQFTFTTFTIGSACHFTSAVTALTGWRGNCQGKSSWFDSSLLQPPATPAGTSLQISKFPYNLWLFRDALLRLLRVDAYGQRFQLD